MEDLRKDFTFWYSKLEGRGKIVLYLAAVALVWLIVSIVLFFAGINLLPGIIFDIILGILCAFLITLVVAQFLMVRNMLKDTKRFQQDLALRGRRGGNPMEGVGGRRTAASGRKRGGGQQMQMAAPAMSILTEEMLDKQFRPKLVGKPSLVSDWMEIEGAGIYALSSAPKEKVEIIDASALGGGFYVGRYSTDAILKERTLIKHASTGEPLRYASLRNAKKAVTGKSMKKRTTKSKKKKRK